jgi:hypothetical protein
MFLQRLAEGGQFGQELTVDLSEPVDRLLQLLGHLSGKRGLPRLLEKAFGLPPSCHHDSGRLDLGVRDDLQGLLFGIGDSLIDMVLGSNKQFADLDLVLALLAGEDHQGLQPLEHFLEARDRAGSLADGAVDLFDRVAFCFHGREGEPSDADPIGRNGHSLPPEDDGVLNRSGPRVRM